jgi:transposase
MIDQNMIEYDRMMQEKHEQGENKRFTESRKRRREMEDVQKGVRSLEEKAKAEIRAKE